MPMLPPAVKDLVQRQRERLKEAKKNHRDRVKAADQRAGALRRVSELIVRAYCLLHGTQRRTRRRTVAKQPSRAMDGSYTPELRELIDRAQRGDETALPELRQLLNSTPELWQQVGDLAKHVESAWMKLLAGNDLFTMECIQRGAEQLRQDLLGDDSTPIERHMVERFVASWLQVQHAGVLAATSGSLSECQRKARRKRLENAQKYHLAAINQLLKVRKVNRATKRKTQGNGKQLDRKQPSQKRVRRRVVV